MCNYRTWGFMRDPFEPVALPPSPLGRTLLVGREKQLGDLSRILHNTAQIPTLEGPNGTGKTSLANVASYVCFSNYLNEGLHGLVVPCLTQFQLRPDTDVRQFEFEVLLEVAQSLVTQRTELLEIGRPLQGWKTLDKWLNSPIIATWQANAGVHGFSFGLGRSAQINAASGYAVSGFRHEILTALIDIFSPGEGVVCVIDNLELVESAKAARRLLEGLRDVLFNKPGLRWILAGAGGVIDGVASSPRLDGYLASPMRVLGIENGFAEEILLSRIRAFAQAEDIETYLPIVPSDFAWIYCELGENIRSTIRRVADYCTWVQSNVSTPPESDDDKTSLFHQWVVREGKRVLDSVKRGLTPRAWEVFEIAVSEMRGYFAPSEFERFGFRSVGNLRKYVVDLEDQGLVSVTTDDEDKRRKTITVTPKGWFVNLARSVSH